MLLRREEFYEINDLSVIVQLKYILSKINKHPDTFER